MMYRPHDSVIVVGKWLQNLRRNMLDNDYCPLCEHHLRDGHHPECPMIPNPVVLAVLPGDGMAKHPW